MLELFLLQMLASGSYVSLRAFNNLNVYYERYLLIPFITFLIAIAEVLVIQTIANSGLNIYLLVMAMTIGGTIGCYIAMFINKKIKQANKHNS